MKGLVGVDWGTSSLRAARMDAAGRVLEERAAPRGILSVAPGEFPAVLRDIAGDWMRHAGLVLVSGMAGSRQGWMEAPYVTCPAGFGDLAGRLAWPEPGRIALVPGLRCDHDGAPDVMRGEETQVLGALDLLALRDATLVLPGTHSKWVTVRHGRITGFATFMTGEIFALLRHQSILARSLPSAAPEPELDVAAFTRGIDHAMRVGNLLGAAFSTRTLSLFEELPENAGPSYLSGLVIGEELRTQRLDLLTDPVIVIGSPALALRYERALAHRGIASQRLGEEATWRGLAAFARSMASAP